MIKLKDIEQALRPQPSYKMLINGQWVESSDHAKSQTFNPATGELLADYPAGTAQDVNTAVAAAKRPLKPGAIPLLRNVSNCY
ncbi:gamma-aminobutyraldehyde dehydrogenase [Morganella morganii]|nr:gamma-aminobutyraldehyde dehydrogenase [Morganella morganii]